MIKNRLTLQAVVDGVVVSDAVFYEPEPSAPAQRGARSYTFVVPGIAAGTHSVELRAAAVAASNAVLSDRTLTVASAPEATADGGMVATGTQSAPMAVTSNGWANVPALATTFNTSAAASTVVIDTGAEASVNTGRLFLRALIDGEPARPADVTFLQGEPRLKAQSFSFGVDNLHPGPHSIQTARRSEPRSMVARALAPAWAPAPALAPAERSAHEWQ